MSTIAPMAPPRSQVSAPPDPVLQLVVQLQVQMGQFQAQVFELERRVHTLEQERRAPPAPPAPAALPATVSEHRADERAKVLAALEETGWNKLEAARKVGLPRRTFYRRLEEYGIQVGDSRTGLAKKERERTKAAPKP